MNLDEDLGRLDAALWRAVDAVAGPDTSARVHELGRDALALREGRFPGGRHAFAARLGALDGRLLEEAARVYTQWLQLMNVAEEQQRIRVLRERPDAGDGVVAAIAAMAEAGMTRAEVEALFARALVMPVITAHPTEARRRSLLDHLAAIAAVLDTGGDEALLHEEVLALHGTEPSRARQPTPRDEIEAALDVFRRTLLDVTPRLYRTVEDACARQFGGTWRLPCFFRWGTWLGGDRDGYPNITAHVTRAAFERHRELVLGRYLADVERLGRALSISELRARDDLDELHAALARDRARFPEVAARARPRAGREPWREKLWYVQARLRATLDRRDDAYVDVAGYQADLALLDRSLRAAGFAPLADGFLRDCVRRADVFGFHLASIDLRQHSGVHERVVDELLARGGRPGYAQLDEHARRTLLAELIGRAVPPERDRHGLSVDAQDLLATLDMVGRARHELGPRACERYVVSFTSDVSDLLEVALLARAAGMAPGELRPIPLLEQLEDLRRAGEIATAMATIPALSGELSGELEVMIGYSDAGKQVGYVTAAVALREAQLALVKVSEASAMTLTVFHGRGGAIGRGGGPAGEAIRAQPVAAVRGRIRVTEQGETVTARYARPEIAVRDLELTVAAILRAAADEKAGVVDRPEDEAAIGRGAEAALAAYQQLTSDRQLLARYTLAATPIREVAKLPLGSRPAARGGGLSLEDLRAIPWVFSWTQSRHGIPGWFGLGSALERLAAELTPEGVRQLDERSRFFRTLVRNAELALIRADIDVAAEYARLADAPAAALFDVIAAEHARTLTGFREILGHRGPFADRPHLASSVGRRNPYLDVLSHVQIEALRRLRALDGDAEPADQLTRTVFTTISGIAAGLQTAG